MRTASKLPARRERKKAPAYIKRLANISNTAFQLENGERVIRRPTYREILDAQQQTLEINRTLIHSMLKRYIEGSTMTKGQAQKLSSRADDFAKAWRKQNGRCYHTGIKLCGGPEFFGLGAGFMIDSGQQARVLSYPLAGIAHRTYFSDAAVEGWREISAQHAASGDLSILLWRRIIPAIIRSKIKNLPIKFTINKQKNRIIFDARIAEVTKFNDRRGTAQDGKSHVYNAVDGKPFWYIQNIRSSHIMNMAIDNGMVTYDGMREWVSYNPTHHWRDAGQSTTVKRLILADPETTVERIVEMAVDNIHEQYITRHTYNMEYLTHKHALDSDLTECDIWRI